MVTFVHGESTSWLCFRPLLEYLDIRNLCIGKLNYRNIRIIRQLKVEEVGDQYYQWGRILYQLIKVGRIPELRCNLLSSDAHYELRTSLQCYATTLLSYTASRTDLRPHPTELQCILLSYDTHFEPRFSLWATVYCTILSYSVLCWTMPFLSSLRVSLLSCAAPMDQISKKDSKPWMSSFL